MQAFAANYWLSKGADPQKMTIGLPLYGRTFTLRKAEDFGIGAAASGGGKEGKFTREEGYLAYYEVIFLIMKAIYCACYEVIVR